MDREQEKAQADRARARTEQALRVAFEEFMHRAFKQGSFEDGTHSTFTVEAGRMSGDIVGASVAVTYRDEM